jgi:NAD-dependent dihydropyrimidine dehydrogenase PreA subunit
MRYLKEVVTLSYDETKCDGCRRCTEVCPHAVFVMHGKIAQLTDKNKCIECGACQNNCESEAITVTAGVGCAAALINSMITGNEPQCGCSTDDSQGGVSCC